MWQPILLGIMTILAGLSTIYSSGLNTGILSMKITFNQALLVGGTFIIFGIWIFYLVYKNKK